MKILCTHTALACILLISSVNYVEANPEIQRILREFNEGKKDPSRTAEQRHRAWLKTAAGQRDAQLLADHFDSLPMDERPAFCAAMARTGSVAIIPFLKKALRSIPDAESTLMGLSFACSNKETEKEFGPAIAEAVVPWTEGSASNAADSAITILPQLDPELAKRHLINDRFMSKTSVHVQATLLGFYEADIVLPRERIDELIISWRKLATAAETTFEIQQGYELALFALARHDPKRAIMLAEELMDLKPDYADSISVIYMAAVGLSQDKLLEAQLSTDFDFAKLPREAQHYYAILNFVTTCRTEDLAQAFQATTAEEWSSIKEGLKAIGDKRWTQLIEQISALFGPQGPSRVRSDRKRQILSMTPGFDKQTEMIWDQWNQNEAWRENPFVLLHRYAAAHADAFSPLVQHR